MIQQEGIDNLTLEELQSALRARGMGATGLGHMKKRLRDWLELSLDHNLPASLLLLSRTFLITQSAKTEELLKDTIASLPEELIGEVQLKVEKHVTPDVKLEILQRQNEIMNAEREEKEKKAKEEQKVMVQPSDSKKEEEKIKEKLKGISEAVQILSAPSAVEKERAELLELKAEREKLEKEKKGQEEREKVEKQEKEKVELAQKEQIKIQEAQEKEDRAMREEQLKANVNVIAEDEAAKIAEQNKALQEKAKKEQEERAKKEQEAKLKKEQEEKAEKKEEAKEAKLEALLDKIISKLEKEVDKVEKTVGTKLHVIDTDKDGVISTNELQQAAGLLKEKLSEEDIKTIITKIDLDHDGRISLTGELMHTTLPTNL
jgi:LETM1 and EF-hand domain-containing protein 1